MTNVMRWVHYASCLWPGLPELWWRGRISGLAVAIPCTVSVNVWLVTRFIYPGWIAPGLVAMAFWIGLVVWITFVVRSVRELPSLLVPRAVSDQPDRFPEASQAYLRGNWVEAEACLQAVLAIEPRDPPALLLLTGVYRHTDRLESAQLLLDQVGRLEVTEGWRLEVQAEQRRLERAIEIAKAA